MAYVFDPINNTLIDDEDKSLGNKLALNDEEFQKLLDIPGVFRASEAPQPPERPDVQEIEMFNRFNREYPEKKAEGGRINFGKGSYDYTSFDHKINELKAHFKRYQKMGGTLPFDIFSEAFAKENFAEGGSIRQNFVAAGLAVPFASTLSYPASYGLATLFGLSTAGGAKVLGDRVTNHIKDNPEILNDPRFKAAALTFGINLPGYIAPDADEMEREKEKIKEMTKPTGFPAEPQIDVPLTTGEKPEVKIDTKESFPASETMKPIVEGFPAETQQLPIIFEQKNLKEDVKNREYDKEGFFENINKYSKEKHGGNLKRAIADLTDTSDNKQLNNVYTQIVNAANRKGFKFDTAGLGLESNIAQSKVPVDLNTLTTTLRTNPGLLDNRIKELKGLDLNKVYNKKELADIIGLKRAADTSDKVQVRKDNFLMELLLDQGLKYKDIPGGKVGFTAKETINALKDYSKNKMLNYESRSYSGNLRKKSTDNYKLRAKVEGNDYMNLQSQINKSFTRTLLNDDLYLPNSVAEFGHNPVPVALTKKIKMLNNKELSKKIFNIQNQTWQGKEINYDTLMRTSGKVEQILKEVDKFFGKKITKNSFKELNKLSKELDSYYNSVVEKGGESVKNLPFHKDVIGKLNLTVPNVGDKLTADNFNVDMSGVDKRFIIGNVDLINPDASRYADLTKEEKEIFGQNIIDQKIEQLREFYGPEGANFPQEVIDDFIEKLEFGTAEVMGMTEREGLGKISKASGGGVEITPLPRSNFGNGGAAKADENFATELEYFLTNEDAELPQLSTFKETKNPLEIINDIIDPRNYEYYANKIGARTVLRIAEFAGRIAPATGKLISDIIQKPAFKIKDTDNNYVQDYVDELPPSNITGTGIFSEFLTNIIPTSLEKKIGLDKKIEKQEQKLMDRGSTVGPVVFSDILSLGAEVTAPIFPGLKLLRAYAKSRNLPANDVTKEILVKEIDEVLEQRGMNRREFLQATGAGATVILAKMLGFGDEIAQTAKVAEKAVPKGPIVPNYFFTLADKIKKLGTDKTKGLATVDREAVYVYKNYELYEDLTTGSMRVTKRGGDPDNPGYYEEEMVYTKGIGDESTKGTPADEYDEFTVKADNDGKMKDVEDGLEDLDELINELGAENISLKDLETMGYEADMLPISVREKLGLKTVSPAKQMLKRQGVIKNVDDDLPDLP